jgi:hypothetical protein
MSYSHLKCILIPVLLFIILAPADAQIRTQKKTKQSVTVLPFKPGSNDVLKPIANEITWMLSKKLEVSGMKVSTHVPDNTETSQITNENLTGIYQDALAGKGTNPEKGRSIWLVGGEVPGIRIDLTQKVKGPRFIGYRRYPVQLQIQSVLYHIPTKTLVYQSDKSAEKFTPRFSFLGFHGKPFPDSPRTIDALIHETIVSISKEISTAIETYIRN